MSTQKIVQGDSKKYLYNLLANKEIDFNKAVLVTDPPYNVGYHYNTYIDNLDINEYWGMLREISHYFDYKVFIMYPEDLYRLSVTIGEYPQKVCSWVYNANTAKQHRDIAYFGFKPDFNLYKQPYKNMKDKRIQKLYKKTGGARSYDWKECPQIKNKNKDDGGIGITHPCQMPIEITKWICGIIPKEYMIVDAFAGSGSIGVACVELDRNYLGIEIDKDYVALGNARIDKYLTNN